MDTKTIIGAVVAVIMLTAVVVPLTSALGTAYSLETNSDGFWKMNVLDEADGVTVTAGEGGAYTINDESFTISEASGWTVYTDKLALNFTSSGIGAVDLTGANNSMAITSVVFENGTATITTSGSSTVTISDNSYLCIPDKDGKYALYQTTNTFKVEKGTALYGIARPSFTTEPATSVTMSYTISDDGISNIRAVTSDMSSHGTADITATAAITSYGDSTYSTGTVSFTLNSGGTTYTSSTVTGLITAPIQYKSISENDSIVNTLVAIIPVLLAVAVVIGIVTAAIIKKE